MQTILASLLSQALANSPAIVLFLTSAVVGPFAVKWLRAHTNAQQQEMISNAANVAYFVVKHIADATPNKVDDQVAEGVKVLRDQLATHGIVVPEAHLTQAIQSVHAQYAAGPQP